MITVDQNKEPVSIDDDVEQNSNSDEASDDQITPEWHFVENKELLGHSSKVKWLNSINREELQILPMSGHRA